MPPRLFVFAALAFLSLSGPALADCADPAEPKVTWRRCSFEGQAMAEAKLAGATLRDTSFQRSTLNKADLSEADGYRTKFISATARGARFDGARLLEADFTRADLTGATFRDADLRNAKMVGASLANADFTGAKLGGTDFRHADLSGARWIDGARVCADSSIGQCN
ncbi:pentapeptide repeat-containing protein [Azospirillum doebereinerae]|uniref:Pentapeptide repeat-containing protein n=1 Tax=Azospirillum doebereinerae TaxID=92933 RepID=A0A3S0V622_9PROT|nr:pentapeptide repeat-containing protein [Azospirillum doebereinerae]MCG5239849.1 pentapeptide repeat-containing protein [Azospirillum doebereinerae]RUQ70722.1 pentapeptide repeat-containing protein [Azospirillum doebereinerae]